MDMICFSVLISFLPTLKFSLCSIEGSWVVILCQCIYLFSFVLHFLLRKRERLVQNKPFEHIHSACFILRWPYVLPVSVTFQLVHYQNGKWVSEIIAFTFHILYRMYCNNMKHLREFRKKLCFQTQTVLFECIVKEHKAQSIQCVLGKIGKYNS